jgi:hypothetical protein
LGRLLFRRFGREAGLRRRGDGLGERGIVHLLPGKAKIPRQPLPLPQETPAVLKSAVGVPGIRGKKTAPAGAARVG